MRICRIVCELLLLAVLAGGILLCMVALANAGWITVQPTRQSTPSYRLPILIDIESHLWNGHPYADRDTSTHAHEGTHGINGLLRNSTGKKAFYVLNGKAFVFEPLLSKNLYRAKEFVPASLRGGCYWYMQPGHWWYYDPSHIIDEFTAYTNGSIARNQMGRTDRRDTVAFTLEFIVYSSCVFICDTRHAQAEQWKDKEYKTFMKWSIERAMLVYKKSNTRNTNEAYLQRLRTSKDAMKLRESMRAWYGKAWTRKVLGF